MLGGVALDSRHSNLKNALILAAEFGNLPIVEKLLNKKILDINSCDQEGDTPLHWAVYKGQTETVKLLLQRGASLDPLGFDGSTPFFVSIQEGHIPISFELLEYGANPSIPNNKSITPLHQIMNLLPEFGSFFNSNEHDHSFFDFTFVHFFRNQRFND